MGGCRIGGLLCRYGCFFCRYTSRVHINAALEDGAVLKHDAGRHNITVYIAGPRNDYFLVGADIAANLAVDLDNIRLDVGVDIAGFADGDLMAV